MSSGGSCDVHEDAIMSMMIAFGSNSGVDRHRVGRWQYASATSPTGSDQLEIWYGKRWEVVMHHGSNGTQVFSSMNAAKARIER